MTDKKISFDITKWDNSKFKPKLLKRVELTKPIKVTVANSKYKHIGRRICIKVPFNEKLFKELKKLEKI